MSKGNVSTGAEIVDMRFTTVILTTTKGTHTSGTHKPLKIFKLLRDFMRLIQS